MKIRFPLLLVLLVACESSQNPGSPRDAGKTGLDGSGSDVSAPAGSGGRASPDAGSAGGSPGSGGVGGLGGRSGNGGATPLADGGPAEVLGPDSPSGEAGTSGTGGAVVDAGFGGATGGDGSGGASGTGTGSAGRSGAGGGGGTLADAGPGGANGGSGGGGAAGGSSGGRMDGGVGGSGDVGSGGSGGFADGGPDSTSAIGDANSGSQDSPLVSCPTEGAVQCNGNVVKECVLGAWIETTVCAQGCSAGQCTADTTCVPEQARCYLGSVERCNAAGTAWLGDGRCACGATCADGLCAGACTSGDVRCNAGSSQVCSGGTWSAGTTCSNGCSHGVCVESELANQGVVQSLSGKHVYSGCVSVTFTGTLQVPDGQTLEIWAKCLTLSAGSSITLGTGSRIRVRVTDTIDIAGTASGGDEILLQAGQSLTQRGTVSGKTVILRADTLTLSSGSVTNGTDYMSSAVLYGSSFTNQAGFTGTTSLMPPEALSSPTNPAGATWNLSTTDLVVSWQRPFPSVTGYYVVLGNQVPGPGVGQLVQGETVTFPTSALNGGTNRIRVTTRGSSEAGTVAQDLFLNLNGSPPIVSSSTHPDSSAWGGPSDVQLAWRDPSSLPAGTWNGYYYKWDHRADTVPTPSTGTAVAEKKILLTDQAPGVWYFHVVGVDCIGRTTPTAGHWRVNIGPDPGNGNIAGNVTDAASGAPIDKALVVVNGGIFTANSSSTGDFTMGGKVPASSLPYEVVISAPGYAKATVQVTVSASATAVINQALTPAVASLPYTLGREYIAHASPQGGVYDLEITTTKLVLGPRDRLLYSTAAGSNAQEWGVVDLYGNVLYQREGGRGNDSDDSGAAVAWTGRRFVTVNEVWDSGQSSITMRTYDSLSGSALDSIKVDPNGRSPAAMWDGSNVGVFASHGTYLIFRKMTESANFADGKGETDYVQLNVPLNYPGKTGLSLVWTGSNYGLLVGNDRSVQFWAFTSGGEAVPPERTLATTSWPTYVSLVWDGGRYHAAYLRHTAAVGDEIVIQPISAAHVAGTAVSVTGILPSGGARPPSLAFDGRYLLLAWQHTVEVRDPATYSVVQTIDLGDVDYAAVTANPATGQAVVSYGTSSLYPGAGYPTYYLNVRSLVANQ